MVQESKVLQRNQVVAIIVAAVPNVLSLPAQTQPLALGMRPLILGMYSFPFL